MMVIMLTMIIMTIVQALAITADLDDPKLDALKDYVAHTKAFLFLFNPI